MRIIIKELMGMSITIAGIEQIKNEGCIVLFMGENVQLIIDGYVIATSVRFRIDKKFLLMSEEVYFDTRIEEAKNNEAIH